MNFLQFNVFAKALTALAMLFFIVAVATNGWYACKTGEGAISETTDIGLWKACSCPPEGCVCIKYRGGSESTTGSDNPIPKLNAAAAFLILAMFTCIPSLILPSKFAIGSSVATVLFSLLAFAIAFGTKMGGIVDDFEVSYGGVSTDCKVSYSGALCIIGWIFSLAATGLFFLSMQKAETGFALNIGGTAAK